MGLDLRGDMAFEPPIPSNWNRAFNIWIHGIQVGFQPVVDLERRLVHGGFLRQVRGVTRYAAALVAVFFCLHCTRPQVLGAPAEGEARGEAGFSIPGFAEIGEASWYGGDGDGFEGRATASGESYDPERLTCAHRTLPLGSHVEIENLETRRSVILRVNDRGPFIRGRIVDVSRRAARELGFIGRGTAKVRLRPVTPDGRPAPAESAVELGDPYTIQVASLSDPDNATRLVRELEQAFSGVSVQEAALPGGRTVHRVRVGVYTRLTDAKKAAEDLQRLFGDRGVEPFITRRR